MNATGGAGTAYPSSSSFRGIRVTLNINSLRGVLIVLLFFYWPLYYLSLDLRPFYLKFNPYIFWNVHDSSTLSKYQGMFKILQWNAMLRKAPTLKIARSSPRNSLFIGHASNPPEVLIYELLLLVN
jgi:hypothetical protein